MLGARFVDTPAALGMVEAAQSGTGLCQQLLILLARLFSAPGRPAIESKGRLGVVVFSVRVASIRHALKQSPVGDLRREATQLGEVLSMHGRQRARAESLAPQDFRNCRGVA